MLVFAPEARPLIAAVKMKRFFIGLCMKCSPVASAHLFGLLNYLCLNKDGT